MELDEELYKNLDIEKLNIKDLSLLLEILQSLNPEKKDDIEVI